MEDLIYEDVKIFYEHVKQLQEEKNKLKEKYAEEHSLIEKKQQDLLHYIEFNNLSTVGAFKIYKELQHIRSERRKIKNSELLVSKIQNKVFSEKLSQSCNDLLLSYKHAHYSNRFYVAETLDKISNKTYKRVNKEV